MLGEIHDRQVLIDRLGRAGTSPELRSILDAEILTRHADYLRQRKRLHGMIAASHQFAHRGRHWGKTLASGALVAVWLPVGVALLGRQEDAINADPVCAG